MVHENQYPGLSEGASISASKAAPDGSEEERESNTQKEEKQRDSRTRSCLSENTTFHTDQIRRGLQDASSLQNVERAAPMCVLVPRTRGWKSLREAP